MVAAKSTQSLAQRLGARIADAHAQYKDVPVKVGQMRLPDGIENGIAQLDVMTFGIYAADVQNKDLIGQDFFRANGKVIEPKEAGGMAIEGLSTTLIIPLCDTPNAQGKKKGFADHWFDFQNVFKMFGVYCPIEIGATDRQQVKITKSIQIDEFYKQAAKMLAEQKPYFVFRTWKGKKQTSGPYKDIEPRVNEEWQGKCDYKPSGDPSLNGMVPQQQMGPEPFSEPPQENGVPEAPQDTADIADHIAQLLATALGDPKDETQEGVGAKQELAGLAEAAGATDQQIKDATWEQLAEMAMGIFPEAPVAPVKPSGPVIGQKFKFTRRDSKGQPLLNPKTKQPFPAVELEVVFVDPNTGAVTGKGKDGKLLSGLNKKTTEIKPEWMEPV